ncbi:MAG: molybdopterin-dependent oxidoreductase [Coriobacteriia bacterium]
MRRTSRSKLLLLLFAAVLLALCAACVQEQSSTPDSGTNTNGVATATAGADPLIAKLEARAKQYAPKVTKLSDGALIQRTPTEYDAGIYNNPGTSISYNNYYLDADNRGCNSCHADLGQQLSTMTYNHVKLSNPYGIQITVQMCIDCHSNSPGYVTETNGFGSLMHGIHKGSEFEGDCWSCHYATNDGQDMQLWDVAKHSVLRGIKPVESVSGDFSFNQDATTKADDVFDYGWLYYDNDYLRRLNTLNKVEDTDSKMFNDWTIKVTGAIDTPATYKLTDLIKDAPSETVTMAYPCTMNPTGGPLIANATVKGIPVSWLLQKAGLHSNWTAISGVSSDGFTQPNLRSKFEGHEAYLVYEIDGKRISWAQGYPVQLWVGGGTAASNFIKQVSEITVSDTPESDLYEYLGWQKEPGDASAGYYNKPNIGLFETQEGRVIQTGKAYTFEGYANGWDDPIAAIEFSMDGGATWTTYQTPGVVKDKWVNWKFTFTPAEDGAYVLKMRSVSQGGLATEEPVEVLVNAQS